MSYLDVPPIDFSGIQRRQQSLRNRLNEVGELSKLRNRNLLAQRGRQYAPNLVMGNRSAAPVAGGDFEAFMRSIASQESGGNYKARGIKTKYGTALGKYQILDTNIPSWSREALGRSVSTQEYLNSPQIQEAIARYKLKQYYDKYGVEGAAKAWYGGEGAARRSSNRRNNGGRFPSLNEYAAAIARRLQ